MCMYICMYMCVCVYVCVYVCICTYACVCLCVCMCVKINVQYWLLSSITHYFSLRQHLSLNPELTDLTGLAGQQIPGILLSLPPQSLDYKCLAARGCFVFNVGAGDRAQITSMCAQRTCYQMAPSLPLKQGTFIPLKS